MKNKKGFFLAETMVVITVVAVVLITVFKVFSSVYLSYRQSEKYNTVAAVNAAVNVQKYYNSIEIIDTNLINPARSYVDLTNGEKYNSEFYSKIKEEYNITNIFLVDLDNIDSHLSEFNLNMRRYLQTIKNKGGIVLIVVVNNDEFAYLKIKTIPGKLCTYDGELVQGVEFIDGQYTYRYMQEYNGTTWDNITNNGWGVILTDKYSTSPVTSKLCTYINNKPIVSMAYMFYQSQANDVDLSGFDTSNVTSMKALFYGSNFEKIDVSNFDTSNVEDMESMFRGSYITQIVGLENFETPKLTNMHSMFYESNVPTIDLSSFDTSKVTDMVYAFYNATATVGYARTQADANRLNASSNKPSTLIFVTKYSKSFTYLPDVQTFTVEKSGYYKVELWGAQGGYDSDYPSYAKGAYTSGYIYMNAGDKYYVYVGQAGDATRTNKFNGGAYGGLLEGSYSGGGATDIRYFSSTPSSSDLEWNSTIGLNSRIMVAGGGGGTGHGVYNNSGGNSAAGGLMGNKGGYYSGHGDLSAYGMGGTQVSGGAAGNNIYNGTGTNNAGTFGIGGTSESTSARLGSAGGGGGYYGGGAGGATQSGGAGHGAGGGSSFISGYAGVDAITSSSDRTHIHNTKHYSGKYFINGNMLADNNSGDGKAIISYIGDSYPQTKTTLNNVRYIKDCINGSSVNSGNHWVEIQAIKDGTNVAKDKTVTGTNSQANTTTYAYSNVVDGQIFNITGNSGLGYTTSTGLQCITVDLGSTYDLDELVVWHYYPDNRTYSSNTTMVSSDNSSWTTIVNTSIAETVQGRRITAWD